MKELQNFHVKSAKSMKEGLNMEWRTWHTHGLKIQYIKDFSSLQINPLLVSNAILIKNSPKKFRGNWKIDSKTLKEAEQY